MEAAHASERISYLGWMFQALGPMYGLLLPMTGLAVFIGAVLVVALILAADAQPPVVLAIVAAAIGAIALVEQVQHPARRVVEG